MKPIDKLLKYLNSDNVADELTEEQSKQIAEDVLTGYEIDEDSRSNWLETNKSAMMIIKHCEDQQSDQVRDFPFQDSAKVIYPLLAPAVIQMAARMCTHIVQNDQVCKFKALGPDLDGAKAALATKLTNYASYSYLLESKTWLKDTHKLCMIMSGWGTAFRQVYYDRVTKRDKDELLAPEDVIINHNITCLEDAPRVTIRHLMTKNRIIEMIRSGQFSNIDLDEYENIQDERVNADSREINPAMEVLCQTTYIDLDGDDYAEPYKVYILKKDCKLLGIYPAFKLKDIDIEPKTGKINYINRRLDIVDFHCIDDPEGKFYSIGLNYLLVHTNKSITSILRQLLDSGTLANTQGGFVTKAFKTQKRNLEFKMGEFQVLDIDPSVNPQQHIIPLPFKEPSQVLLALLQVLIQSGKETGFITDVLTGDVEGQNTPATTMLAMVEQGTRAFKPVIQKLYISLKNEFTLWFEINSEYLNVGNMGKKYANFNDEQLEIGRQDFDIDSLTICPVADPTQCSEAHKYAKVKFVGDLLNTPAAQALNIPEVVKYMFAEMQITNPALIAPPQAAPPDPKLLKVQLDEQKAGMKHQIDQQKIQLGLMKAENDKMKTAIDAAGLQIDRENSVTQKQLATAAVLKQAHDAHTAHTNIIVNAKNAGDKIDAEHRKLDILEAKPRNPTGS